MDYCDKPSEFTANPDAKRQLAEIAMGNAECYTFMWAFWNFTHLYDDLVDQDKKVTPAEAAKTLAEFVISLSVNQFYRTNTHQLLPLILSACDRWVVGDKMKGSLDYETQIMSRVVRCGDLDVYAMCAYLVGGWDHLRAVSEKLRTYDA